ncbi:MAG: hypothetical protein IPF59_13925 [Ignavibacteria bacterium]|nr:hypothetical protein [Ignavibacteria bacterium]
MSQITYFQRYSTEENWMTNSTLLLLSRIYEHDHRLFERILNEVLALSTAALEIGPIFQQQVKSKQSVPDGMITQEGYQVIVEAKLRGAFDVDQLERHKTSFDTHSRRKILLALAKDVDKDAGAEMILQDDGTVIYVATTYDKLISVVNQEMSDRDYDLKEIIDDYEELCISHGLTSLHQKTMLAVTAGETLSDNMAYRLYYDSATRKHNTPFKYLGLYNQKRIVAIGK